eukprot:gnl/Dysnectes_brevis/1096_a1227_1989.p1 GENE.gnl/Dysnectes_brevis/1096_a1227_1989~~gnl/Dysnectes_brevis/1096_a1227_1989.p1  ORF type:complete len:468 (-),score=102.65 gnl/Dysnectes_brevis/1096_a1227_1989:65-1468(-)
MTSKEPEWVPDLQDLAKHEQRYVELTRLLNADHIDKDQLISIAKTGIPDSSLLRSIWWMLLLDYLPLERIEWNTTTDSYRYSYSQFIDELMLKPIQEHYKAETLWNTLTTPTPQQEEAHTNSSRQWSKMKSISKEVAKDIYRTHASLHMFAADPEYQRLHQVHRDDDVIFDSQTDPSHTLPPPPQNESELEGTFGGLLPRPFASARLAMLFRILFIHASLNIEGYVQGQNEVCAILLVVLSDDSFSDAGQASCEADCFYCFGTLMSMIRDIYIRGSDTATTGLMGCCNRMQLLMDLLLPTTGRRLRKAGLTPHFYAVSWISSLFSQQLRVPDTIRVWDSLLAAFADYAVLRQLESRPATDIQHPRPLDWGLCLAITAVESVSSVINAEGALSTVEVMQALTSPPAFTSLSLNSVIKRADHHFGRLTHWMREGSLPEKKSKGLLSTLVSRTPRRSKGGKGRKRRPSIR